MRTRKKITPPGWRWRNIPVPEPHLVAIGVSMALQRAHARRNARPLWIRAGGAILVGTGIAIGGWATRSAAQIELDQPRDLVTDGAYASSRNPMYVGWTLIYVGYGLWTESAWPLVLFPGLAAWMHRTILEEERRLEARFESSYRDYVLRVPRYLGNPRAAGVRTAPFSTVPANE